MMLAMSWVVADAALRMLLVITLRGAANTIVVSGKPLFPRDKGPQRKSGQILCRQVDRLVC